MKKYLTLLFLVCAVALTFTGCYNSFEFVELSGDGNHSSGGTVNPGGGGDKRSGGTVNPGGGSDKPSGGTVNPGGGSSGSGRIIGTWYGGQAGVSFTLTFKEGGSFSYTTSATPGTSVPGTYTLDGSKVTVRAGNVPSTGTYSGSTISFPRDGSGGLFMGLTFTKR